MFEALEAGDILFIDSSHIAMPGTDVDRLFLDVLPRLAGGTLVHIHDIALPYAYPKIWAWRGYNEQLLAGALLQGGGYELVFASHYRGAGSFRGLWPGHPVGAAAGPGRARDQPLAAQAVTPRSGRSRLLPGLRHGNAGFHVFVQLVAQGADRDAQDPRRMGPVAEAEGEGVEDQVTLHIGDGPADENAPQGICSFGMRTLG